MNAADDPTTGSAYLTLTGTSAEMGDDGSVGRGNRPTGLTSPLRASTIPAAGKNPAAHPGKLYNVLAEGLARAVVEETPGVDESRVLIITTVGEPLHEPTVVNVAVRTRNGTVGSETVQRVTERVREALAGVPETVRSLLLEVPRLY